MLEPLLLLRLAAVVELRWERIRTTFSADPVRYTINLVEFYRPKMLLRAASPYHLHFHPPGVAYLP